MTEATPEKEITIEERVRSETTQTSRALLKLIITRPVNSLNNVTKRVDRSALIGAEGCTEFRSFKDPNMELKRLRKETPTQVSPPTIERHTQTHWSRKVNSSAQTEPLHLLPALSQAIVEKDDFRLFLTTISLRILPILESNIASDVFTDQLAQLVAVDDSLVKSFSVSQMKERFTLKDARYNDFIQCIDWMPNTTDTVGVSFSSTSTYPQYLEKFAFAPNEHIFIWSFTSILHPLQILESPSIVKVFKFCPTKPHIIVAGCENGQVLLYDLDDNKTKSQAELRSSYSTDDTFSQFYHPKYASAFFGSNVQPTKCHSQPICDLHWLPPGQKVMRTGDLDTCEQTTQFVTCGIEGRIVIWDINIDPNSVHPNDQTLLPGASLVNELLPSFAINAQKVAKSGNFLPVRYFHLVKDHSGMMNGECRFVTDNGEFFAFNWLTSGDRSIASKQNPTISSPVSVLFHTPCAFVASPFIDGLYLVCDRTHIVLVSYRNSCEELFRSGPRNHPVLCVSWSPRRPSVFIVGNDNGSIEIWALLDKSHDCLFTQSVSSTKVTSIKFGVGKKDKELLCVGSGDGSLLVYKVPDFMSKPISNELELMQQFVNQQQQFVKQTAERFRVRQAAAQAAARAAAAKKEHGKPTPPPASEPPKEGGE